jgi:hypothetical protein
LTFLDEFVIVALPTIICIYELAYGLPITAESMPCTRGFGVCMRITIKFIRDFFQVSFPLCGAIVSEDL